jgi:hypothetical protein
LRISQSSTPHSKTRGEHAALLSAPRVLSGGAPGLEECEQDRQRQALVIGHRKLIETERQPWMPGERAKPFVVLVDEASKLPFRQLELDQRKCRIGPSAGPDQLTDPCLGSWAARCKPRTRLRDDPRHKISRDRLGAMKLSLQPIKVLLKPGFEQHDVSLNGSRLECRHTRNMGKTPY